MDSHDEALKLRLSSARAAQERTRLALFATTVIAFALLTATWNAYISFYRSFAFDHQNLAADDTAAGTRRLQETVLTEWVRSHMISVALLGIQVGVDDAPTLGAFALVVALVWLYLAMRREHYTLGYLLHDYAGSPPETRWLIFHGINLNTVFITIGHSDAPMTDIRTEPPDVEWSFIRTVAIWTYWLPAAASITVIGLDIASLFLTSPFREPPGAPLYEVLMRGDCRWSLVRVVIPQVIGLILSIVVVGLCWRTSAFAQGTTSVLRQFADELPEGGGVPAAGGAANGGPSA